MRTVGRVLFGLGLVAATAAACASTEEANSGLAACATDATPHVSGERLRGRYAVSDEGDCAWLGWYDRVRGEACSFRLAADGAWRCLPDAAVTASAAYTDEACSQPLFFFPEQSCAASATHVLQIERDRCSPGAIVRDMGPPSSSVPAFSADFGGCMGLSSSGIDWYDPGPELPLEEFVAAELSPESLDSTITRQALRANDGAFEPRELFDPAHGACEILPAQDGIMRCLPSRPSTSGIYADAGCSEPALLRDSCAEESSFPTALVALDDCRYAVHERGQAVAQVYGSATGQCELLPSSGDPPMFESAGELAANSFVEVVRTVDDSDPGRLKPVTLVADAASSFGGFYDSELGVDCAFELGADGELRCLPKQIPAVYQPAFSDDACSERVLYVVMGHALGGCAREIPRFDRVAESGACPKRTRVRQLGEPLAADALPSLWELRGSQCERFEPTPEYRYVPVGNELEPARFVRAEVAVE